MPAVGSRASMMPYRRRRRNPPEKGSGSLASRSPCWHPSIPCAPPHPAARERVGGGARLRAPRPWTGRRRREAREACQDYRICQDYRHPPERLISSRGATEWLISNRGARPSERFETLRGGALKDCFRRSKTLRGWWERDLVDPELHLLPEEAVGDLVLHRFLQQRDRLPTPRAARPQRRPPQAPTAARGVSSAGRGRSARARGGSGAGAGRAGHAPAAHRP